MLLHTTYCWWNNFSNYTHSIRFFTLSAHNYPNWIISVWSFRTWKMHIFALECVCVVRVFGCVGLQYSQFFSRPTAFTAQPFNGARVQVSLTLFQHFRLHASTLSTNYSWRGDVRRAHPACQKLVILSTHLHNNDARDVNDDKSAMTNKSKHG